MTLTNQYVKIILISTLGEPKRLTEISTEWFNNKARLYQPDIMKYIKKAVDDELLIQNDKYYHANIKKVIELMFENFQFGEEEKVFLEYKQKLIFYYTQLSDYTRKTYLHFDIIKDLTKMNLKNIDDFDIKTIILMPFILRCFEQKDKNITNILIQFMNLEEYVKLIEKLELENYSILKDSKNIDTWVEYSEWLSKSLPKMQKKGLTFFSKNKNTLKKLGGL
jgi:hypothetical protein